MSEEPPGPKGTVLGPHLHLGLPGTSTMSPGACAQPPLTGPRPSPRADQPFCCVLCHLKRASGPQTFTGRLPMHRAGHAGHAGHTVHGRRR